MAAYLLINIYTHRRDKNYPLHSEDTARNNTAENKALSFSLLLLILLNYVKNSDNYKYTKQVT